MFGDRDPRVRKVPICEKDPDYGNPFRACYCPSCTREREQEEAGFHELGWIDEGFVKTGFHEPRSGDTDRTIATINRTEWDRFRKVATVREDVGVYRDPKGEGFWGVRVTLQESREEARAAGRTSRKFLADEFRLLGPGFTPCEILEFRLGLIGLLRESLEGVSGSVEIIDSNEGDLDEFEGLEPYRPDFVSTVAQSEDGDELETVLEAAGFVVLDRLDTAKGTEFRIFIPRKVP